MTVGEDDLARGPVSLPVSLSGSGSLPTPPRSFDFNHDPDTDPDPDHGPTGSAMVGDYVVGPLFICGFLFGTISFS